MIIHGSMAAELKGSPFIREEGHKSDIDIYGTNDDFNYLINELKKTSVSVHIIPASHSNRKGILATKLRRKDQETTKTIDFELLPQDLLSEMYNLPDNTSAELFGTTVTVVSEITNSIIKRSYRNASKIFKQKHQKDIDKIKNKALPISEQHINFFNNFRKHAKEMMKYQTIPSDV